MNKQNKVVRVICLILAGLMVLGIVAGAIMSLLG